MRYLSLSELIYINGALLGNAQIMSGKQKIRDIDLLKAAVLRPQASAFGADAYATLEEKTAALLHSLARNHPFTDGNKRTAATAAVFMLGVNGRAVVWDQPQALEKILSAAQNTLDVPALAAWLPTVPGVPAPEPDLDRDKAHIDRIMREQKWLLDELQAR